MEKKSILRIKILAFEYFTLIQLCDALFFQNILLEALLLNFSSTIPWWKWISIMTLAMAIMLQKDFILIIQGNLYIQIKKCVLLLGPGKCKGGCCSGYFNLDLPESCISDWDIWIQRHCYWCFPLQWSQEKEPEQLRHRRRAVPPKIDSLIFYVKLFISTKQQRVWSKFVRQMLWLQCFYWNQEEIFLPSLCGASNLSCHGINVS